MRFPANDRPFISLLIWVFHCSLLHGPHRYDNESDDEHRNENNQNIVNSKQEYKRKYVAADY